ncbi:transposase [Streptococcus gallinaceus]|uniref:IS1182 family transposase n=1 Tax=Streptococcus gallinaceus TaxID=165758 RepID=UPI00209C87B7|nr:IS1182 family transposase [Streptococcus gallinaceus]MCP1638568.1 transposase [Streptococcus gallinaceus]MCP1769345.1 transposase [Streptococcus gallinaceus]
MVSHHLQIYNISELIEKNHISRLINEVVEGIDDKKIKESYSGGGSSYHPKMMLKVIIYAYTEKITSGRKIAKLCKENIPVMWLAGRQRPDFKTINRFRVNKKELIDSVFESIVIKLIELGEINTENYFLDGTKIEANANKYSFIWKKSVERYSNGITNKIREFLDEAAKISKEELEENETVDAMIDIKKLADEILENREEITSKEIRKITNTLEKISEEQTQKEVSKSRQKPIKKLIKKFKDDLLPRQEKYEKQKEILGERNSYSKTDEDATFMRMKDDHMKNGQLKAGYNIQVGTNNQYILNYTIHQNPGDTRTFKAHIENLKEKNLIHPKRIVADAGYGSEVNYLYCLENNYEALIPYNMLRKEGLRKTKKDVLNKLNWKYNCEFDSYTCPNGRYLDFKNYKRYTDKYGYTRDIKVYECYDCSDCPLKSLCTQAKGNRKIEVNPTYEELKAQVRYFLLEDEQRKEIYSKRKIEIESVFGNLKQNQAFTRFTLRGIEKVEVEFALHAISHNLKKLAKSLRNKDELAFFLGNIFLVFLFLIKKQDFEKNLISCFFYFGLLGQPPLFINEE